MPALSSGMRFAFPEVGEQTIFLMDHDEIHSLRKFFPEAEHIKFWMGFGEEYRKHFNVLKNGGLLSPDPVAFTTEGGEEISLAPIKLLRALLPDPASLAARYVGKTCIGVLVNGEKDGEEEEVFLYNISDHQVCYKEAGSQAISYTAGVPPSAAAVLIARGEWQGEGVFNAEELPPGPFLALLEDMGMPWEVAVLTPERDAR